MSNLQTQTTRICLCLLIGFLIAFPLAQSRLDFLPPPAAVLAAPPNSTLWPDPLAQAGQFAFLPILHKNHPWQNPFGIEPSSLLLPDSWLLAKTLDLSLGWVRLNGRISWRELQPNEGDPIAWDLLANFENELRVLRAARIRVILVVDDYPRWATDNTVRADGQPTSCGPLREDRLDDFALFMQTLVARYHTAEFNVHIWELGNEPDVDPDHVPPDSIFGCWGDRFAPLYGGDRYGEMLKVVSPAIKAADPLAQVWIGGLLLGSPNSSVPPEESPPETFLRGVLAAGAAPYFDVVPYHAYPGYNGQRIDQDTSAGGPWDPWGGWLVGKARYLRLLMSDYNVTKPLWLNETAMNCSWCWYQREDFVQMQADFVSRSLPRTLNEHIFGPIWYTLDGPGWRFTGLLDEYQLPKPVYYAYQNLIRQLQDTEPLGPVDYGTGIEAYAFGRGGEAVHIVYARENTTFSVSIPVNEFIAAYTRDGAPILVSPSGPYVLLTVQFEPIYIIRTR